MRDRKLATRYARALLSLLPDAREAQAADAFLDGLRRAMESSDDTRDALLDPAIPRMRRREILVEIARRQGAPVKLGHFLAVLVDHHRTAALPAIAQVFHEELEKRSGIVPAEVTTSAPLGPELEERVRGALERATGRQVRLSVQVDPALLGGAVTRIGSTVYDGSLRTQLERLRARMAQE